MSAINAENVTVHCDGYRRTIACECDGHRYHVWLDSDFKPVDTILYKNPPLSIKPQTEGYYHTRKLSTGSTFGSTLLHQMLVRAGRADLFRKALLAEKERAEGERRELDASALYARKRAAAQEMFQLLAEVINADVLDYNADGLREQIIAQLCTIDENYEPMETEKVA